MKSVRTRFVLLFLNLSMTSAIYGQGLETAADTFYGAEIDSFGASPRQKFFTGPHASLLSVNARELDSVRDDSPAYGNGMASIHVQAHAAIGDLGVGMTLAGVGTVEDYVSVNADASASWQDNAALFTDFVAMDAPVIAHFNIFLEGDLSAVAHGAGAAQGIFNLIDNNFSKSLPSEPYPNFHAWGFVAEGPTVHIVDEIPGGFRITETILNTRFFTVGFGMDLKGQAATGPGPFSGAAGSAIFTGDIMHSLRWGGIESITDASGNEIPRDRWTFVSDSGFDYSQPFGVPEPVPLSLVGLAFFGGWLWRSGRSRTCSRPEARDFRRAILSCQ